MQIKPVTFEWNGEAFVPLPRFRALCDRQYVVHEEYILVPEEPRSRRTHNHFFAALHDAWKNLPEALQADFPDEEMLRKRALIHTGFFHQRSIAFDSRAQAENARVFMQPMDEYALIVVSGTMVTVYTAQSQSKKAMGGKKFQESKTKVLDWVADLIGTTREQLEENAKRVA